MTVSESAGQVITFYSYKGGTGRSMALANVACLLAKRANGKRILAIDWDLEAPGLHRFLESHLQPEVLYGVSRHSPPGLIDLFRLVRRITMREKYDKGDDRFIESIQRQIEDLPIERYVQRTKLQNLDLMCAGKFDDRYPKRVNTFDWDRLYKRVPWLMSFIAKLLMNQYEYVLIDSRTGITDTSGICTTLIPEKLVVVFTPNRQSLFGALELVKQATSYRRQSDDLRRLLVYPLPSRIETSEPERRNEWRFGDQGHHIEGYQRSFEKLFEWVYDLPGCSLEDYFDKVQIQHVPRYSYGEEIAVLVEGGKDRLSLRNSYEVFADRLVSELAPWESTEFHSCAILYSVEDAEFAKKIHTSLRARGVRCSLFPESAKATEPSADRIDSAISGYDKTLFIFSPKTNLNLLLFDIEVAREAERGRREAVMLPILLDWDIPNAQLPLGEIPELGTAIKSSTWRDAKSFENIISEIVVALTIDRRF